MPIPRSKFTGFTLVELIVVIAIIAVLAMVGIVNYQGVSVSARDTKKKGDVEAISQALENHFNRTTYQYPNSVADSYFASGSKPKNIDGTDYTVTFNSPTNPGGFEVCANLEKPVGGSSRYCKRSLQGVFIPPVMESAEAAAPAGTGAPAGAVGAPPGVPAAPGSPGGAQSVPGGVDGVSGGGGDILSGVGELLSGLLDGVVGGGGSGGVPAAGAVPESSEAATPTIAPTATPTPQPKYVFVTSTVYQGNLSAAFTNRNGATEGPFSGSTAGLDGADARCQDRAEAGGIGSPRVYKAWLSAKVTNSSRGPSIQEGKDSASTSPESRMVHSTGLYVKKSNVKADRSSGPSIKAGDGLTTIASSWADLTDGNIAAPINFDESGRVVGSSYWWTSFVWTTTDSNGNYISDTLNNITCNNWNSSARATSGRSGTIVSTDGKWTDQGWNMTCEMQGHLYCFEQ